MSRAATVRRIHRACVAGLAAAGLAAATAGNATAAGPVIDAAEVRLGAAGAPPTLVVRATDPDAPVTGVTVDRGGESFGASGCRRGRERGSSARFEIPLPGSAADVLALSVTVLSGGCSGEGRSSTRTLVPVLPASGLPGAEGPALVPLPGVLPILGRAAAGCRDTGLVPADGNLRRVRRSVMCLINATRRARGLRRLRGNRKLERAATRHSRDMLRRRYFNHVGPGGDPDLGDRLRKARYRARGAGENIGAGTGHLATPAEIVAAWMDSLGHRANILKGSWRHVGIGVVASYPVPPKTPGGAYTAVFARR